MHTKHHILFSTIFCLLIKLLIPITWFHLFLIWISSWFLIDLDHPIYYSIKTKNFNPRKFLESSRKKRSHFEKLSLKEKKKIKTPIFIFHGVEILIILTLLTIIHPIFYYILIGFIFHLILDFIDYYKINAKILSKASVIYTIIRNKKRKKY